jgi:uncharacterized protein YecT (DUF1311 family)
VRSVGRLAISGTLLLLVPAAGRANGDAGAPPASFECTKASTRIEKMICSDGESSELDGKLAETYRRALADPAENPDQIRIEQRTWLSGKRNRCADVRCLRRSYRERIAALEAPMRPLEVELRSGTARVFPRPLRRVDGLPVRGEHLRGGRGWLGQGGSDDSVRYIAVIKPIAGKTFERACLLRASGAL